MNNTCLLGVTLSEVVITHRRNHYKSIVYISSSFSKEQALTLTISSTYTLQSSYRYRSMHAKCGTRALKKQTKQIEYIQRRAMRVIFQHKSYTEAINVANLPKLSDRRREKLCRTVCKSTQQPTHKLQSSVSHPGNSVHNSKHYDLLCAASQNCKISELVYHML